MIDIIAPEPQIALACFGGLISRLPGLEAVFIAVSDVSDAADSLGCLLNVLAQCPRLRALTAHLSGPDPIPMPSVAQTAPQTGSQMPAFANFSNLVELELSFRRDISPDDDMLGEPCERHRSTLWFDQPEPASRQPCLGCASKPGQFEAAAPTGVCFSRQPSFGSLSACTCQAWSHSPSVTACLHTSPGSCQLWTG